MAVKTGIHKTKFSQVTATPPSLAVGEQAYSTVSNSLFIGDATGTPVKIGGAADVTKLAGIEAGAQVNTVNSVNTMTGNVVITKATVSLSNVDNTSDASKPVSTAQQNALDLKANLANPTFTGTVSGITATMVGLNLVNNTADTAKPVSTAQQAALDLKANSASPIFTGTVTLPTTGAGALEAATKGYVDSVAAGINIKDAVKVATTAPGTLTTSFANGATVGGLNVVTGDRILIKNQVATSENGIYIVNATGVPSRAPDFDNVPTTEVKTGAMTYVSSGTLAGTQWVLLTPGPITLGTTGIQFSQFGGGAVYSAGTGLSLTGSVFAIDGTVLTTSSAVDVTKFTNGTASSFNAAAAYNLNATNIASGTLALARLHANVVVDGDTLDGGSF